MENKKCKNCEEIKPITEFGNHKITKDGLRTICKICNSNNSKKYYNDNIDLIKDYYKKNNESIKNKRKEYYKNNIEKEKEKYKIYRKENIIKIKEKQKEWFTNNPNYKKEWVDRNPNYHKEYSENYKLIRNEKTKERKKTDLIFNLRCYMNRMINTSLKKNGFTKQSRTHDILGCSYEEFKEHLELLWSHPNNLDENGNVWMNWENRGLYNGTPNYGWDVDHIVPQSSANTEEELLKLNHFSNLQPLCSYINRVVKRNK
jgi:hypothetical protein